MPINPAREQVQGTGTNLTASVQSGQQIASQQISDSFNYGEEARDLRRRAADMQEASTVNNILVSQGELELQRRANPSKIALTEAQARSANVQSDLIQRELDLPEDQWRARYNSATRLNEAQASTMEQSAAGTALKNEEERALLEAKKGTSGYFERKARADIQTKEAEASEAGADADSARAEAQVKAGTIESKIEQEKQKATIDRPKATEAEIASEAMDAKRPELLDAAKTSIDNQSKQTKEAYEVGKKKAETEDFLKKTEAYRNLAAALSSMTQSNKIDPDKYSMAEKVIAQIEDPTARKDALLRLQQMYQAPKQPTQTDLDSFAKSVVTGIFPEVKGDPKETGDKTGEGTATPTATATPDATEKRRLVTEQLEKRREARGKATPTPMPSPTPTVSELINKTAAGEEISVEDQPIKRIANSLLEAPDSPIAEGETIASLRDKNKRVRKEFQMDVASQANMLVNSSLKRDTEADIDNEASIESIRLIDPDSYAARQKRAAEIGLFQQASGMNQLDSQLVSTALNLARDNRAGKREVSQLRRQYGKELQTGGIVDGILDVVEEADPRILADFVANVPEDRGVRKGLGIQYFSSLQGKISETGDPAIKAPLKRELAKQALVVMPDAVKEIASFWNSGDLIDKTVIAGTMFNKDISQLEPQEKAELNSMVSRRVAFQQAAKKMGLGSGKLEDIFTVAGHDLDYYSPNDPVRAAAERALVRMGQGADDGVFIMKRHGSGYHAAFAPANDPELSRQALSVQDAMFHYRTALHDGDEADILESVGISTDTLNRFGPEETKSLNLLYGMFPYKEALPGLIKTINGYRERRLSLGDGHELRNDFESQVADVIMYQTKPGLEYNDPNKRGAIMRRVRELTSQSFEKIEAPMDQFGRTTKPVSQRVRERMAQA